MGSGSRTEPRDAELRVYRKGPSEPDAYGLRVLGLGFRVLGLGFRV